MGTSPKKRAVKNHRNRLHQCGVTQFEGHPLEANDELIRTISEGRPKKGGILAALRQSPLVGAGLDIPGRSLAVRKADL